MSFKNDGLESNVKVNVLLPKLEKPVITLLNNTLTINSVEHATGYEIYIDDELKSTVTNLTVDLTENISSLSDYFVSVRAISTDNYDPSKVASIWISNSEEEPGMYDDSGNKICSLPELVIDYNWGINSFLTVHNYDTNMAGLCYILKNTPEFKDVTKLVFDFETTIQSGLFMGCSQLKEIILPEDLTGIGSFAFEECLNLTSINIPNKVTDISIGIFGGCDNLTSISVEPGNAVYYSIDNCIIKSENKTLVLGCKNSIIPSDGTVTIIGNSAFDGCNGLIEVIIPAEITKIGNSSFTECVGLKKVGFETGSKLTNIDAGAFSDCVNLEEFNFPASLRKISGGAFRNDKKLVRAIFEEPATWHHTNDLVASTQYANGSVTPTQCADPAFMANKLLTVSCYQWFRN